MHVHVRVRRWVVWWFYVGVFCGGIALANILGRDLTRSQEKILLIIGALHWLLGGLVCWAFDSVKVQQAPPEPKPQGTSTALRDTEWHAASDFLLPGRRKSLLPASQALSRRRRRFVRDSLRASDGHPSR